MKRLTLPLLCIFTILLFATDVFACSCSIIEQVGKSDKELVEEAKNSADAVFAGEIVEIRFSESEMSVSDEKIALTRYAKFRIERSWKGLEDKEFVEISTGNICCICGVSFEKGQRYIVYAAKQKDGTFSTDTCTRTRMYHEVIADEKYLGIPEKRKRPTKH
ncbi:MAG: hypothetical protein KF685_05470 [Acidobacteria bacterium]|nr:hypothetical protein [Acidobacteriota bacterium]